MYVTSYNLHTSYLDVSADVIRYKKTGKPKAFCSSYVCDRDQDKSKKMGVEVKVGIGTVDCPKCNHALYWTYNEREHGY